MKKTTLAVGTLLAALSAAVIVPAAYADDSMQQTNCSGCKGCKGCMGCKGCTGCKGCKGCKGCTGCSGS